MVWLSFYVRVCTLKPCLFIDLFYGKRFMNEEIIFYFVLMLLGYLCFLYLVNSVLFVHLSVLVMLCTLVHGYLLVVLFYVKGWCHWVRWSRLCGIIIVQHACHIMTIFLSRMVSGKS